MNQNMIYALRNNIEYILRITYPVLAMMIIKWKKFRVAGPLWGESTGHRWISLTKASDAEFCWILRSALEQTVEQTMEKAVIWDVIELIRPSPLLWIGTDRIYQQLSGLLHRQSLWQPLSCPNVGEASWRIRINTIQSAMTNILHETKKEQ